MIIDYNSSTANSSWSRANRPYEITDIDDTSAQLYLQNRGVTEEDAKRAVTEITGGRFHLLDVVAGTISTGTSYEEVKKRILEEVEDKFDKVSINIKGSWWSKNNKQGLKLVKAVANSPNQSELLKHNIFSYHPSTNQITFQSRAVATYVKQNGL
eukprot:TRINITY_DN3884_c0_g1_i3.p1 TRINITY_DN3884_c0_g1~~TRINITY_DN3884_c0_g1_i3.p1  ORF type:complete len:155 (+),score=24.20 TRINITY_DN3884_c0_g1_i3:417-881(+)